MADLMKRYTHAITALKNKYYCACLWRHKFKQSFLSINENSPTLSMRQFQLNTWPEIPLNETLTKKPACKTLLKAFHISCAKTQALLKASTKKNLSILQGKQNRPQTFWKILLRINQERSGYFQLLLNRVRKYIPLNN